MLSNETRESFYAHNTGHEERLIMPREAEPSINEREFVLQALHEQSRIDGRQLDGYRDIGIDFGEQYGVADVRLGKTR